MIGVRHNVHLADSRPGESNQVIVIKPEMCVLEAISRIRRPAPPIEVTDSATDGAMAGRV